MYASLLTELEFDVQFLERILSMGIMSFGRPDYLFLR